jgi:hypothetical protein
VTDFLQVWRPSSARHVIVIEIVNGSTGQRWGMPLNGRNVCSWAGLRPSPGEVEPTRTIDPKGSFATVGFAVT